MDYNWLTPKAEAVPREGKGWGSLALEPIAAGETIAIFGGWIVNRDVLETMSADRQARSLQIDEDLYALAGETPEPGDMINHSCEPNTGLDGATMLRAMRDIAVGEELTFDYATSDGGDYDEFTCLCGSVTCRGLVTGNDWRLPDLQVKYAGWFSPYLRLRIASMAPVGMHAGHL